MKAFLASSAGMFLCITAAEHASRNFQTQHDKDRQWVLGREHSMRSAELAQLSTKDRLVSWVREEKYKIIGATWVASIVGSFILVGRNPYLTGQQKIVQARVYAQGLTVAILCASAGLEIADQRKGKGILDAQNIGNMRMEMAQRAAAKKSRRHRDADLWQDMVAAEELRLKRKHRPLYGMNHEHARIRGEEASIGSSASSESGPAKGDQETAEQQSRTIPAKLK